MRNIDSSEWLTDPSLDILETKDNTSDTGSQFTLNAVQENPQTNPNAQADTQVAATRAGARR